MKCECCKAHIATGSRYVVFHGRPWISEHAANYLRRRAKERS